MLGLAHILRCHWNYISSSSFQIKVIVQLHGGIACAGYNQINRLVSPKNGLFWFSFYMLHPRQLVWINSGINIIRLLILCLHTIFSVQIIWLSMCQPKLG